MGKNRWGGGFPGHLRHSETDEAPRGRAKDTSGAERNIQSGRRRRCLGCDPFKIFLSSLTSFTAEGKSSPAAGLGLGQVGGQTPNQVLTPPPGNTLSGTLLPGPLESLEE